MADCAVRSLLIVVSAPSLQLFGRVCKRQEPVGVQTLRPQSTVKGFDIRIVSRLAGPREVKRHALGVSPQVDVAGDEL